MNIKETSQTNYFQLQAVLGSPPYYSNWPAYGTLDPDDIKNLLPFLAKPAFIEPPYGVLLDGPSPLGSPEGDQPLRMKMKGLA